MFETSAKYLKHLIQKTREIKYLKTQNARLWNITKAGWVADTQVAQGYCTFSARGWFQVQPQAMVLILQTSNWPTLPKILNILLNTDKIHALPTVSYILFVNYWLVCRWESLERTIWLRLWQQIVKFLHFLLEILTILLNIEHPGLKVIWNDWSFRRFRQDSGQDFLWTWS